MFVQVDRTPGTRRQVAGRAASLAEHACLPQHQQAYIESFTKALVEPATEPTPPSGVERRAPCKSGINCTGSASGSQ
jgi:hypothetical protein